MDIPVIILAGGLGTRLSSISNGLPKALVNVAEKPFIDWKIEELISGGATVIYILVGHKSDELTSYIGKNNYQVPIAVINDGPKQLGTAGAINRALPAINGNLFIITYGDNLLSMKVEEVFNRTKLNSKSTLVITDKIGPSDSYNCKVTNGLVEKYSKQHNETFDSIDYGYIGMYKEDFLEYFTENNSDLAPLIGFLAEAGKLAAIETSLEYLEIGTPEGLQATQLMLKD